MIWTIHALHVLQGVSQFKFLEILMNGSRRVEGEFQRRPARVGELQQTLIIWFLTLLSQPHQSAGVAEEHTVKSGGKIQHATFARVTCVVFVSLGYGIP